MYDIEMRTDARTDLKSLRKSDQQRVLTEINEQLRFRPTEPTRNRKRLRPNPLATWELRVDRFRIFYDVHESEAKVEIVAVGYKEGGKLFLRGKERSL